MKPENLRNSATEVLSQGIRLLEAIDASAYTNKIPQAFNASIGTHFRHCLDHFEALIIGHDAPVVDYDARKRDPQIEANLDVAIERARDLHNACSAMKPVTFNREVAVRCKVACDGDDSPLVISTFAREIMYAVVHAIHHYALINVMCELMDIETPEGFGIAPSTIQHHAELSTASA